MPYAIGTSGWSYDDWVGPVYPEGMRTKKDRWLFHYGKYFSTVEINSTFYSMPRERTVQAWVEKGRKMKGFEFSIKLPQDITHKAMVEGWDERGEDLLEAFCVRVLEPLKGAGLLGCALLQLSPYFKAGDASLRTLDRVLGRLGDGGYDTATELRHSSWVMPGKRAVDPEAVKILDRRGSALCITDGPGFPALAAEPGKHSYFRFHGRNDDLWFGRDKRDDDPRMNRYDYSYSEEELREWISRFAEMEDDGEGLVRIYFNNHPRGQAVFNALQTMDMLGIPYEPLAPQKAVQRGLGEY